jgi:splicing factor U2AF subunit
MLAGIAGATTANRGARRLYIGNVGPGATEGAMTKFFNERMVEHKFMTAPGDAAIAAQVNGDKGWAFVEFRSAEETTNAMGFDGIVFQGSSLKIRRPKDYLGPDIQPPSSAHVPGVISTNVPDGPNKIYVGGLPTYLQDEQVIELLKAFGELRAFNLVRENGNGASKGYAFCEYVDAALTEVACAGLNDMELGDRRLVVQRASMSLDRRPMPTTVGGGQPLGLALPVAAAGPAEPTRAMMMLNMVTPDELLDDVEYGEILEDIRDELAKFGTLLDVRIPRPQGQSKGAAAQTWKQTVDGEVPTAEGEKKEREGVGRVYVKFDKVQQCQIALRALAGRQFGGRTVICAHLNESDCECLCARRLAGDVRWGR